MTEGNLQNTPSFLEIEKTRIVDFYLSKTTPVAILSTYKGH